MRRMTTTATRSARLRGLVAAAHAPPSAAVTIMAALLAVRAGLPVERILLVALAVGLGQLSIGWLNDWWDADADRAAGRSDKPVVAGVVSRTTVGWAAVVATVACVAASASLGAAAGVVNVLILAAGWAYDLRMKFTRLSIVPYLVAFGSLPAVPTLAATPPEWPPAWMVLAGALLGAGGHFANALPDLESDARVRVAGLPQRLGERTSLLLAAGCLGLGAVVALIAATAVGTGGATAGGTLLAGAGLAIIAVVLGAIVVTARHGRQRVAFRLTMALAIVVVAVLVVPA